MSESPQSTTDLFPHPTIEKSTEEPNYYSIKPVEKKLTRNVASIPTELGGGNHGFLGLVVTPQKHVNITHYFNSKHFLRSFVHSNYETNFLVQNPSQRSSSPKNKIQSSKEA